MWLWAVAVFAEEVSVCVEICFVVAVEAGGVDVDGVVWFLCVDFFEELVVDEVVALVCVARGADVAPYLLVACFAVDAFDVGGWVFGEWFTDGVDADGCGFVGIASPCDGCCGVALPAVGCPCP